MKLKKTDSSVAFVLNAFYLILAISTGEAIFFLLFIANLIIFIVTLSIQSTKIKKENEEQLINYLKSADRYTVYDMYCEAMSRGMSQKDLDRIFGPIFEKFLDESISHVKTSNKKKSNIKKKIK